MERLLRIQGMPRSTFYYNTAKVRPDKWSFERREIVRIYHENKGRYGYRRITEEMHNRGYIINHKTVRRLMKEAGVICRVRMKKYHSYKGEVGKIAPNILDRNFGASVPLQKLVTDVTEFSLFGEKLYLSPVLDLYNGEILTYTICKHPVLDMVLDMARRLVRKIGSDTCAILHSDQGFQYQHRRYQKLLADNGLVQSMSRKGNCLDNSVMENFFGLLKSELLYLQDFNSMDHFQRELRRYIKYYNERRIKMGLNGKSPKTYRIDNGYADAW